jgi:hypothetical protein
MKIIKNTSGRSTREIKKVFTIVHHYMKTLEHRPAPNWRNLRVVIAGRETNYAGGRSFYNGRGGDWDLFLTIPRPVKLGTHWASEQHKGKSNFLGVQRLASLVYHELMHTYGYKHSQFTDITEVELNKLFPEAYNIPTATEATPDKSPKWRKRYDTALINEKRWLSKQKRAANALKKVRTRIKYFERKYGGDL